MCKRYVITSDLERIEQQFAVDGKTLIEKYKANPNTCKGDNGLIITNDEPHLLQSFSFGFIPFWSRKKERKINARVEGKKNQSNDPEYKGKKAIVQLPRYSYALRRQRCIIIADAFIAGPEDDRWQAPHLVYSCKRMRPFAMAGIWDAWIDENGNELNGFAILTTPANALLQAFGCERAPVVLDRAGRKQWLNNDTALDDILDLLEPFDTAKFNSYRISRKIKTKKNKALELLVPVGAKLNDENNCSF